MHRASNAKVVEDMDKFPLGRQCRWVCCTFTENGAEWHEIMMGQEFQKWQWWCAGLERSRTVSNNEERMVEYNVTVQLFRTASGMLPKAHSSIFYNSSTADTCLKLCMCIVYILLHFWKNIYSTPFIPCWIKGRWMLLPCQKLKVAQINILQPDQSNLLSWNFVHGVYHCIKNEKRHPIMRRHVVSKQSENLGSLRELPVYATQSHAPQHWLAIEQHTT